LFRNEIYSDAKKFLKSSKQDLVKIFGTEDVFRIAEEIVKTGHVDLTAEYLNKEREAKKRQIIDLIARSSIDPKTGKPHPPQRIESALQDARVKIDEHKSIEEQIKGIVSKLATILPIKYGAVKMMLKIPAKYNAAVYSVVKQYTKVSSERWENNGDLVVNIEVPSSSLEKFENSINNITHGEIESKKLE
jgi:ribosome maturation protein SDO1